METLKNLQKFNFVKKLALHRYTMNFIILVSIGIFIGSNILISYVSARLDLSEGQAYTLAPATRRIISTLEKPVVLTFYVSSNLPATLQPAKREVTDLLTEYQRAGSKVTFRVEDPKTNESAKKKATEAGFQEIPFQQLAQNKYEVSASYFGILIEYEKTSETIPQATDLRSLEYNLSSAIYRLTKKDLPKIAILGYDEGFMPQQDALAGVKNILKSQFAVQTISPQTLPPEDETAEKPPVTIDKDVKTLLIFDNSQKPISAEELDGVKKYLSSNGKAIVFTNGVSVSDDLQTADAQAGLIGLLKEYGMSVEKNLLISQAAELVNFGQQGFSLMMPYPFWVRSNVFDRDTSYFSNVSLLTFPWVSSITTSKKQGIETRDLIKTVQATWAQKAPFVMDPQGITQPPQKDAKQFTVAAESLTKTNGQIMAIASSRFLVDRYISDRSSNLEFILNALNDYASGGALSGIRARAATLYPLPELPQSIQNAFQYTNIFVLPLIFALYGFIRVWMRGKSVQR